MRQIILLLFCVLSTLNPAYALPRPVCGGRHQYRGASGYPSMSPKFNRLACDKLLQIDDRACAPGLPILWEYFGNDPTCPAKFTARYSDRPHLVEIFFTNEACRKKHTCYRYFLTNDERSYNGLLEQMSPSTKRAILARLNKILAFVQQIRLPHTEVSLSLGLEDSFSAKAWKNLYGVIKPNWPYDIVKNSGGPLYGADYIEYHEPGIRSRTACYANEDGQKVSGYAYTRAFLANYRNCHAVFPFRESWQGKIGNYKGIDPAMRNFTISPQDIKGVGDIIAK